MFLYWHKYVYATVTDTNVVLYIVDELVSMQSDRGEEDENLAGLAPAANAEQFFE